MAPLRVLSMDIECAGSKVCCCTQSTMCRAQHAGLCNSDFECCPLVQGFPSAQRDPVIQIASMITVQGESKPVVKNVMTLNTCAGIVGSEVMAFQDERDLLKVGYSHTKSSSSCTLQRSPACPEMPHLCFLKVRWATAKSHKKLCS